MAKEKKIRIKRSTPKEDILKLGSACMLSGHCCRYGSGFVIEQDIKKLADHFDIPEEEFKKKYLDEKESFATKHYRLKLKETDKPYGECIFLKDNMCSIHDVKPLHCRVGNCSRYGEELSIWFFLNHFVNEDNPESIRQWALYLKTHPTIEGGKLEDLVPDKEKLGKIMKYEELRVKEKNPFDDKTKDKER